MNEVYHTQFLLLHMHYFLIESNSGRLSSLHPVYTIYTEYEYYCYIKKEVYKCIQGE